MTPSRSLRWLAIPLAGTVGLVALRAGDIGPPATAEAKDGLAVAEVPVRRDPPTGLSAALGQVRGCDLDAAAAPPSRVCAGVLYVWSDAMPLSGLGIREIVSAGASLGLPVALVEASALEARASSGEDDAAGDDRATPARVRPDLLPGTAEDSLRLAMVGAGATLHHPAVLVHRGGRLEGSAILGYKTGDTWARVIEDRLASPSAAAPESRPDQAAGPSLLAGGASAEGGARTGPPRGSTQAGGDAAGSRTGPPARPAWRDLPVDGRPGPYFRWVPGRGSLAFEDRRTIHLLDLATGQTREGPGWIDLIPSPDGLLFVMPGPGRHGLHFYDAAEVYRAARAGRASDVEPFFVDPALRDQYPSVGVLASEPPAAGGLARTTLYRVLTSWYDGVVFRDYEVGTAGVGGGPSVRPRGARVPACPGVALSIPILSRDGREVAGRDEATGTTKIFRLENDGRCRELLDLGIPTGKVAFGPDGRRVAFAVPDGVLRDGGGVVPGRGGAAFAGDLAGVFVLDRDGGDVSRVEGSRSVDRLTFPDFVGPDSVVFLVAREAREGSRFRLAPVPGGR